MNGFAQAQMVEARAMTILLPYLEERADDGRLVVCNKGPLARFLQETAGDVIFNCRDRLYTVEIKAERKHTGRLFLETWSNRNLDCRNSHADRGCNPGWLYKIRADLLMYYFLDTDDLYTFDLFALKQWAFGGGDSRAHIHQHIEACQGRYEQANDTWGRVVNIDVLHKQVGFKHCKVQQLSLFAEAGD